MKTWQVAIDPAAAKDLRRLGERDRARIMRFLRERIATAEDPRRTGHGLTGPFAGLWSYRIGDYRLMASIQDERVRVLVLRAGHRSEVYR